MRWILLLAITAVAAGLWLPGEAAEPAPAGANGDKISFAQYRDWRNNFIERRRSQLAAQLAAADLPAARKTRLQEVKEYYDWLAGLPAADRDHRFRERFDRIDTDHDGTMDTAERSAWREQRRAFYRTYRAAAQPAAAGAK